MKIPTTAKKFEQPQEPQPKSTKNPPMAAAIRRFVTEMAFPPLPKSGPNHYLEYAGIIQAILSFARGVRADATEISADPAIKQIAEICHVDRKTIERALPKLMKHGQITVEKRAGKSNMFTVHKGATTVVVPPEDKKVRQLGDEGATTPEQGATTQRLGCDNSGFVYSEPNTPDNKGLETKSDQNEGVSLVNTSGYHPLVKNSLDGEVLPPLPSAGSRTSSKPKGKDGIEQRMKAAIAELDRWPWTKEPANKKNRDLWERAIVLFLGSLRSSVGSGVNLHVLYKDAEEDGINLPTDDYGLYGVITLLMKLEFAVRVKSTIYLAEYAPKGDK